MFFKKSTLINMAILCFSTLLALLCTELILRNMGLQPEKGDPYLEREPFHLLDEKLGWRSKPGMYTHAAFSKNSAPITYTILADGGRLTQKNNRQQTSPANKRQIFSLGGSFTFGYAVSDHENWPYHLQTLIPEFTIYNYSVTAYSTYQAIRHLDELTDKIREGDIVIYGFINHHEIRNVASNAWIQLMSPRQTETLVIPHITLDKKTNSFVGSKFTITKLPFTYELALMHSINSIITRWEINNRKNRDAHTQEKQATIYLVEQFKEKVEDLGAVFYLAYLNSQTGDQHDYSPALRKKEIPTIDCRLNLTEDNRVKGENSHPNSKGHLYYANCIKQGLVSDLYLPAP